MGQLRQSRNGKDVVVGQVEHQQFLIIVQVLNIDYHIVLQEEVLKQGQTTQIFYLLDDIVLQVEGFQIDILIKILDSLNALKVEVKFVIEFGKLIETLLDAQ